MSQPVKTLDILLIEDDPTQVILTEQSLKTIGTPYTLNTVSDGVEAYFYLRRQGKYQVFSKPDLILLDLNLPKADGREVLKMIKSDSSLAVIPVVVLSTSGAYNDVTDSYNLHANSYVLKPFDLHEFRKMLKLIVDYWTMAITLS